MACNNSIQGLVDILKQNSEEEKSDIVRFTCKYGLLKGLQLQIDPLDRERIVTWKSNAKDIEDHLQYKRAKKMESLREQVGVVEQRLKHKNISVLHSTDENHNLYNDSECKTSCSGETYKDSIDDDCFGMCIPLSLESVNFKELTNQRLMENRLPEMTPSVVCDSNHASQADETQKLVIVKIDNTSEDGEVTDDSSEEVIPEVLEQMKTLHSLQEQQKELDEWYHNMHKQLELEKLHLTEKYDQLKLRNIKRQQHVIDSSQEFLKNASLHMSPNSSHKQSFIQSHSVKSHTNKEMEHILESEYKDSSLRDGIENVDTTKSTEKNSTSVRSQLLHEKRCNSLNNPKVKRILPSPPLLDNQTPPHISNSHKVEKPIATSVNDISSVNDDSLELLEDCVLQNQIDSPHIEHMSSIGNTPEATDRSTLSFVTTEKDNATFAQLINRDTMSELKMRRKSRPIKFFTTPISEDGRSPIKLSNYSGELLTQPDEVNTIDNKTGTTSTPQEVVGKKLTHEFSPVYAQGFGHTLHYDDEVIGPQHFEFEVHEKPLVKEAQQKIKIEALARGFLVRRLMNTNKVQDMVKTIKDTRDFLQAIDKESSSKKKNVSTADRQLRSRLQEELLTKRKKLHDVFFNMTPTNQMKFIALSRRLKQEKKFQQQVFMSKQSKSHEQAGKKLSTASQRSMKRRQAHTSENHRPKTAPERAPTPNKAHEKELKPLRPIQSHASPMLSERSRPKSSAGSAAHNRYPQKQVNKKLNMNSATTSTTQRVMAAKMTHRYSSAL